MNNLRTVSMVVCAAIFIVPSLAFGQAEKTRPADAPEIPKSFFNGNARNPFVLGSFQERTADPDKGLRTVSISDAELERYRQTMALQGSLRGEQSWALINGRQFFLNKPMPLDPSRPELKNVEVVAETIDDKQVVLRLLDGTRRTIKLVLNPNPVENK